MLRMTPVDAFQKVGELRRRDHDDAIGWRWPDEPAALQPLGIKRDTMRVAPEDLDEIAAAAAKYEEISAMGIASQRLLDLQL